MCCLEHNFAQAPPVHLYALKNHSSSSPEQECKPVLAENPKSNPPPTSDPGVQFAGFDGAPVWVVSLRTLERPCNCPTFGKTSGS